MRQVNLLFCLAVTLLAQQGPINLNFQEKIAGEKNVDLRGMTLRHIVPVDRSLVGILRRRFQRMDKR